MTRRKKIVLFGTNRHAIAIDDYYMFFSRSDHEIVHVFYPIGTHRNRDWWEIGRREDRARDSIVDPMTSYEGPITVWRDVEKTVFPVLDSIDFDYVCFGNGTEDEHKALIARYGREKFLFSEYGWLPWSGHFYISRKGAGFESELATMTRAEVDAVGVNAPELDRFNASLNHGAAFDYDDFLYMPLQKDVNDFKFLFNSFENNEAFLAFADRIAPPGMTILVKRHPLYPKKYDLSFSNRMVDIGDLNLNKFEIYRRMRAMICLNSTSILEALCFGRTVFSYGDDLFVGKDITFHRIDDPKGFRERLEEGIDGERARKFASLLMSRQVSRRRCVDNDLGYIRRHYWNLCL